MRSADMHSESMSGACVAALPGVTGKRVLRVGLLAALAGLAYAVIRAREPLDTGTDATFPIFWETDEGFAGRFTRPS